MRNVFSPFRFEKPLGDLEEGSNLLTLPLVRLKEHALLAGSLVAVAGGDGREEPVVLTVGVHFQKNNYLQCDRQYGFLLEGPLVVSRQIPPSLPATRVTLLCQGETTPEDVTNWLELRGRIANTHVLYVAGDSRFVFIDPSCEDFRIRAVKVSSWNDHYVCAEDDSWKDLWDRYLGVRCEGEISLAAYSETRSKGEALRQESRHYQQELEKVMEQLKLVKGRVDGLLNLQDCLEKKDLVRLLSDFTQSYRNVVKGKAAGDALTLEGNPTRQTLDDKLTRLFMLETVPITPDPEERWEFVIEGSLISAGDKLATPFTAVELAHAGLERLYHQRKNALQSCKSLSERIAALEKLNQQLCTNQPALDEQLTINNSLAAELNTSKSELTEKVGEGEQEIERILRESLNPFFDVLEKLPFAGLYSRIFEEFSRAKNCPDAAKAVEGFAALQGRLEALPIALGEASRLITVMNVDRGGW